MVWQEINKQWEEEGSVGKADAGQRSGLRGLSGETGPGSEDPPVAGSPRSPGGAVASVEFAWYPQSCSQQLQLGWIPESSFSP